MTKQPKSGICLDAPSGDGSGRSTYNTDGFFDEMFEDNGEPRPACVELYQRLLELPATELQRRQETADRAMVRLGITFNVYGDKGGQERVIPFDIVPRVMAQSEWTRVEQGLRQRILALNMFLDDIYNKQRIIKDGVVPEQIVLSAESFRQQCIGLRPPQGVWAHITGTDLVRGADGEIYVLEDNLRCPSGVSYVLQNRQLMKQTFPQLFERANVLPVDDYGGRLLDALQYLMEQQVDRPVVALLTPGSFNSAFFEHSYLAQLMGVFLVEGRDLVVSNNFLYMRTTHGLKRIDVLYRRVDDDFLDPRVFRKDSMLGVPGLFEVFRSGNVALANAPGTGVADDKVVYSFVPAMIKYYLDEDAILNNVPTYLCCDKKECDYVLANLDSLVVKPAAESGGYGLLIGPQSTLAEREAMAGLIRQNPRNYIAQPTLALSRVPVITEDGLQGRHADLRPYIIYGKDIYVLPGGLTRVALKPGSLVVNSSQGGGSKDTWVTAGESNPC